MSKKLGIPQRAAEFRCMHERCKEESTSPLALAFRLEAMALPLLDRLEAAFPSDPSIVTSTIHDLKDLLITLREVIYDMSL